MSSNAVVRIERPGRPAGRLLSADIRMRWNNHSLAVLRFRQPAGVARDFLWPELMPVVLSYGRSPAGLDRFYGYVHHHEVVAEGNERVLEYTLIGTSLPLNKARSRSWTDVTASYLVKALAFEHGFRLYHHDHRTRQRYVAQDGISDFALLQRLCEETGYKFWAHNGTLWFFNPATLLSGNSLVHEFNMYGRAGQASSLMSFDVLSGSMLQEGGKLAQRQAFGYDATSKTFLEASNQSDAFLSTITRAPVESYSDAFTQLAAADTHNRNWVTAKAVVNGNAELRPGSLVRLGGSALSATNAGVWMAVETSHKIHLGLPGRVHTQSYSVSMELARNNEQSIGFDGESRTRPVFSTRLGGQGLWQSDLVEAVSLG